MIEKASFTETESNHKKVIEADTKTKSPFKNWIRKIIQKIRTPREAEKNNLPTIIKEQEARFYSWYDKPQEEFVRVFKEHIEKVRKTRYPNFSTEEIIHLELAEKASSLSDLFEKSGVYRASFYTPLRKSWDVLAFDRFKHGTVLRDVIGKSFQYNKTTDGPALQLRNPLQIKIINALCEITNLPKPEDPLEIKIPEQMYDYSRWNVNPVDQ